ncbi:DUF3488 and DUF4129 domain-containing transglutaminase family protein [Synechococcus sp. PCC 6312]|uniref:transglutaminase TgpA family protein n=1 Tax=Synechococcus sp. (strain ATCC 27167 / PCC 6312) TaxID=195253 RepID=UPI0020A1D37D|nr:DUF3488 and DUF4129 domain-containing transglutaminase family protein [Synechococcus sp. PCC 6312]
MEESLLLRLAVQVLVIIGILATDIAAETSHAFWAVPLSLFGGAWSWRMRRRPNIGAKFLIAMGMILALVLFIGQLARFAQDSRMLLTELLIQLQVLHSFDLPRRKDLGYSMVIGLILIGVAATLSQTMLFGLFLLLFLAVALPVLVLDYRSRLGLMTQSIQSLGVSRKQIRQVGRQWIVTLALVLGLGMVVFAVLPRLPGYQIRNLPVSANIEVQGQFNQTNVTNPGYVSGQGAGTRGNGVNGELGDVRFSPDFYYGFGSEINQNLRGSLTPKEILRVRSQAPGFWRVMAFDEYTGQGWRLSRNDAAEILQRPAWSFRFVVPHNNPLGNTREVIQTYTVVSEFSNLIPNLAQAQDVFFPTQEIAYDPEGGLRAPLTLPEGLTYSVISQVPIRDRTRLGRASSTYSKAMRDIYLQVPPAIAPKLRAQAQALLAKAEQPRTNPYEQVLFLTQALKQGYRIQPELPPLKPGEDLATAFLAAEGGYPDHFSTVLTLMVRSLGMPARLVTGLGTGEFNPFTGLYIVKNTDAYALTEVFFPGQGWFTFDPIPGHDLHPPSLEVDQTFTVLQQFWNWVAGWLPSPVTTGFANIFALLDQAWRWFLGLFSEGIGGVLQGSLVVLGVVVLAWLLWLSGRGLVYRQRLAKLPPMERLYQEVLDSLAMQGFPKRPSQTPWEYLATLESQPTPPRVQLTLQAALREITSAYLAWRYGQQIANLPELYRTWRQVKRRNLRK